MAKGSTSWFSWLEDKDLYLRPKHLGQLKIHKINISCGLLEQCKYLISKGEFFRSFHNDSNFVDTATASEASNLYFKTFIGEYFRPQDRIKH